MTVCETERHTQRWSERKEVAPLFLSPVFVSFLCNADLACFAAAKSKQKQVRYTPWHDNKGRLAWIE